MRRIIYRIKCKIMNFLCEIIINHLTSSKLGVYHSDKVDLVVMDRNVHNWLKKEGWRLYKGYKCKVESL